MGFKINRVYTRSGDLGQTSLIDGSRVNKDHPRCCIFGGLDEISCILGLAKDSLEQFDQIKSLSVLIEFIQQELFDIGSEVATPEGFTYPNMCRVSQKNITQLEQLCDYYNKDLPELSSFILPGGNVVASHFHMARAVTRRVEREIVNFINIDSQVVSEYVLQYVNRLSDLFFVLSRFILMTLNSNVPLWSKEVDRKFPLDS